MLHALLHDALDCYELRSVIEGGMGDALAEDKERRQELAVVSGVALLGRRGSWGGAGSGGRSWWW